jgi:hypothetical protein
MKSSIEGSQVTYSTAFGYFTLETSINLDLEQKKVVFEKLKEIASDIFTCPPCVSGKINKTKKE